MRLHCTLLAALALLFTGIPNTDGASTITTQSMLAEHNYPYEAHSVETKDGYILTIHRIPYSPLMNASSPRPVVFLQHGLLCSSSDWLLLGPENSLGYILSNAGYDVWMGNARGNRYSRKHVRYSPAEQRFWQFEWHQIALIDLPTMIGYVLNKTGQQQVRYFGHSQGTTSFFVLNCMNLEFKKYVKSAHLLAPVAFMSHLKSPIARLAPFVGRPNPLIELLGSFEFLPNTRLQEFLGFNVCSETSRFAIFCSNFLFFIQGFDEENLNATVIPYAIATTPAGASVNQILHYLQEYRSGRFCQFDYGPARNYIEYGTLRPPSYPLDKINGVNLFLYYSDNDYFADLEDVRLLIPILEKTLRGAYRVPHADWNHFDYLWGRNIWDNVYTQILKDVDSIK